MTTLQVRISEDFKMSAQNLSKTFGVSLSDLVRMAMIDFMKKKTAHSAATVAQKRELITLRSKGNHDRGFHRLSNAAIDRLITSY